VKRAARAGGLSLLPRSVVVPTSEVDHPDWNYRPLLGYVQRLRFRMVLELLGGRRFGRLLEIGYGSGVFMPELAARCGELHGIDPHPLAGEVARRLSGCGVDAVLRQGGVEAMPYPDGWFDCAVAVSALECVPAIEDACGEIARVLRPGGVLALVTPGATPLWNPVLSLLTSQGPGQYGDRRERLQPVLRERFRVEREIRVPGWGGRAIRLYTGLSLRTEELA